MCYFFREYFLLFGKNMSSEETGLVRRTCVLLLLQTPLIWCVFLITVSHLQMSGGTAMLAGGLLLGVGIVFELIHQVQGILCAYL